MFFLENHHNAVGNLRAKKSKQNWVISFYPVFIGILFKKGNRPKTKLPKKCLFPQKPSYHKYVSALHAGGTPSKVGGISRTIFDKTVRNSKEYSAKDISISRKWDELVLPRILKEVRSKLAPGFHIITKLKTSQTYHLILMKSKN